MTRKQCVNHWLQGASENLSTMRFLLKGKKNADALFMGHLALEKTLKALCAVRSVPQADIWGA